MRFTRSAGIALAAGVLGLAGTAGAGNAATRTVVRIGGSSVSVAFGSVDRCEDRQLGVLTIDGCRHVIERCDDPAREMERAFRRAGYRASSRRGTVSVDYNYRRTAPRIEWESRERDLVVNHGGCDEITLRLADRCGRPADIVISNGGRGHEARQWTVQRRERDDHRQYREDRQKQRDVRRVIEQSRRAAPKVGGDQRENWMNLQPYRPVTKQARPKIVGAWVPEPPKE